jgi:hypothetical protein
MEYNYNLEKTKAIEVITNAVKEYKGTWNEHLLIQKSLEFLIALIENYEKEKKELNAIQNFDNS